MLVEVDANQAQILVYVTYEADESPYKIVSFKIQDSEGKLVGGSQGRFDSPLDTPADFPWWFAHPGITGNFSSGKYTAIVNCGNDREEIEFRIE